jgi:uncharacterized protein
MSMDQQQISSKIASIAPELRSAGVSALFLFGSHARGDARPDSDLDFAFEIEPERRFSLLDQAHLMLRLEDVFGRKVDFFERSALRPRILKHAESDMVRLL